VDRGGDPDAGVRRLITGLFTHQLYRLDPTSGKLSDIAIPVEKANPRAIDLDAAGRPWVVLGGPRKLAMLAADSQWRSFDVGVSPHPGAGKGAGVVQRTLYPGPGADRLRGRGHRRGEDVRGAAASRLGPRARRTGAL